MKIIRESSENEMILEFLKGELSSKRFSQNLLNILNELNIDKDILIKGDINSKEQNIIRKQIIHKFRGYPNKELFNNFPKIESWNLVEFDTSDLDNIYYINYDYWNELSNNTSKPKTAAKNIMEGIEIYDVSNKSYLDGLKFLEHNLFPPIILITCNSKKYLVIEGHSRVTIYALNPQKFDKTLGFVGVCSKEEMKKYDNRMC